MKSIHSPSVYSGKPLDESGRRSPEEIKQTVDKLQFELRELLKWSRQFRKELDLFDRKVVQDKENLAKDARFHRHLEGQLQARILEAIDKERDLKAVFAELGGLDRTVLPEEAIPKDLKSLKQLCQSLSDEYRQLTHKEINIWKELNRPIQTG